MANWVCAAKRADFEEIGRKFNISPVLARIIRNRDVILDEEFDLYLNGTIDNLYDGRAMMDMVKACSLICQYNSEGKKFRIIGDYDVDGISSTYILIKGLQACGADVDYVIPHRIEDGYGLNDNLIKDAFEAGINVIITCDNGIAAAKQIEYAYSLGMKVIVTDHHEVPFEEDDSTGEHIELLPGAEAVVDPKREGDNYPFPGVCGAVVAWKLVEVLLSMAGIDKGQADALYMELLEIAAIATVADVMELKGENRIIVKEGLKLLEDTENIGLRALIRATGLEQKRLSAYHIGFVIGPCLNASGRLDTARRALDLLLCDDEFEAAKMANELKELNNARKEMTEQGVAIAINDIDNSRLSEDRVLVVYLPDIHESLAGIIAGRLREKYEKPTIVMTDAESLDGEPTIKGSGRSIEAYDMFIELSKHKELYLKFGGHKMAAGLSMPLDNLDIFRKCLNDDCTLTKEELTTKVVIDIPLPMSYVNFDFVEELELLEPFGNGNAKPIFAQKGIKISKMRILGKTRNLLILSGRDENGKFVDLKMFNKTDIFEDHIKEKYGISALEALLNGNAADVVMDVIYYPGINEFNGRRIIDFIINDYRLK